MGYHLSCSSSTGSSLPMMFDSRISKGLSRLRPSPVGANGTNPIDRPLLPPESEDAGQELSTEALLLEALTDHMQGGDQILEISVLQLDPLIAVFVGLPPDGGLSFARAGLQQRFDLRPEPVELRGSYRLIGDGGPAGRLQPQVFAEGG